MNKPKKSEYRMVLPREEVKLGDEILIYVPGYPKWQWVPVKTSVDHGLYVVRQRDLGGHKVRRLENI